MRSLGTKFVIFLILFAVVTFAVWRMRPTRQAEPVELQFSKEIYFTKQSMSVDGGVEQPLPCQDDQTRVTLGELKLDPETSVTVTCLNEYMAGVSFDLQNQRFELATQDGDAGDSWEKRSKILRRGDQIEILSLNVTSTLQEGESEKDNSRLCEMSYDLKKWNPQTKQFESQEVPDELKTFDLKSVYENFKDCLDEEGQWTETPKSPNADQ